jgi:hypothetical protein
VKTPGPVLAAEWSPEGNKMVLIVNLHDDRPPNAPRVIRGMFKPDGWSGLARRARPFVHLRRGGVDPPPAHRG